MCLDEPPKKRNPNDATFRNIDALKKRVAALEAEVKSNRAMLAKLRKALSR